MWFAKMLCGRRTIRTVPTATRPRFVPHLQELEDRTLPSTITVVNLSDHGTGSLRQAILTADQQPGDVIQFQSGLSGTITLTTGPLAITDSMSIAGPGTAKITVNGDGLAQVFAISGKSTDASLSGLSVVDGRGILGGGIFIAGGQVTLSQMSLADNEALGPAGLNGDGGGIYNLGSLTIKSTAFDDNLAEGGLGGGLGQGGAIFNLGSLSVSGGSFQANQASGGSDGVGGPLSVLLGSAAGGAIANAVTGKATIASTTFTANDATGGSGNSGGLSPSGVGMAVGGGIANELDGVLSVTGSTFTDNQAHGGADNQAGSFTALSSLGLIGVGAGGGVANVLGSSASISANFSGNEALGGNGNAGALGSFFVGSGIGGGLGNFFAAVTVTGGSFQTNEAKGGAGIATDSYGSQGGRRGDHQFRRRRHRQNQRRVSLQ